MDCPPERHESLHDRGWRQGSVFSATLPVSRLVWDGSGVRQQAQGARDEWVVVSQDCDLAQATVDADDDLIEIRAVDRGNPGTGWGIRSRTVRLTDECYLGIDAPRLIISPSLLDGIGEGRRPPLTDARAKALTTWLGRRYDRPAVPDHLVPLTRTIAGAVRQTRSSQLADQCHDVLIQMSTDTVPTRFALVAVVLDGTAPEPVAEWLTRAALDVPTDLGVMATPALVATKATLPLAVLEDSYTADLSDITWKKRPEPRGTT